MAKYIFDNISFKTKKDIEAYARKKLYDIYDKNNRRISPDNEYFSFIMEILNRHAECDEKVGCGVKYFVLFKKYEYGKVQIALKITRIDDTEESFSWVKSVNLTTGRGNRDRIIHIFRESIKGQLYDFKKTQKPMCVKCSSTLKLEIDHHNPTFQQMYNHFTEKNGVPENIRFNINDYTMDFLDEDIIYKQKWCEYHLENAKLRVLCKSCNLKRPKYK